MKASILGKPTAQLCDYDYFRQQYKNQTVENIHNLKLPNLNFIL